jgi:hypothetical protein
MLTAVGPATKEERSIVQPADQASDIAEWSIIVLNTLAGQYIVVIVAQKSTGVQYQAI